MFSTGMLADLEADRALVAEMQARIFDLERSLAELRAEQAMVQERLDSYRYPVLMLPNEIISEIFLHFLPPYPICPPLVGMFSPTHLTHVCRGWRAVALSTPELWRTIGPSDPSLPLKNTSEISDAWARRSGACPLSIEIDEHETSDHPPSILSTLIPHRARWEYLTLLLNKHSQDALHRIEGSMPMLRHLRLSLYGHDPFDFRDLPQLRSVEVVGDTASKLILPWVQLTSLTLRWVEPSVSLAILQQTSGLVHCALQLPGMYPLDSAWIKTTLPCLKSLALTSATGHLPGAVKFFAAIVAPALHRLEVQGGLFAPNPVDSLASFIAASDCKLLQEIHITGTSRIVSDDDYRAAFPSIPTISFKYTG
ncbi:hypothetical protein K438DRAFT_1844695 [Mycena galopus ATCC 62051]|nr:hypothetical protein K438DRAFT_1844695 [Mycena galopus ATCC 62051]